MLAALVARGRAAAEGGRWEEALAAYAAALEMGGAGEGGCAAEITRLIGMVHHQRGEIDAARAGYERSLSEAVRSGREADEAAALICLAIVDQHCGGIEEAEIRNRRAQEIADRLGDEALAATIEHNLGILANIRGDVEGALRRYRSSLSRHRRLGDLSKVLGALHNIGMAYVDLERWPMAARYFNRAEALAAELGDMRMAGYIEVNRAELYLRTNRFGRARVACDRAFEVFGRLGFDSGLAEVNKFYGMLYRETGKPQLADTHLEAAVRLARQCHDRLLEAESLSEWAQVHGARSRNREALHCLNGAHQIFSELHARRELNDLDRRLDHLEVGYLELVRKWAESIESKDRYTAGHCERVANYACMLAEAVGMRGRDLTWLRMGGYLHDVGKIAVPAEVLNKPGKLTPQEWALMQSHTVEGDVIVAELDFPWDIRPIVRSHHERWDGTGYPDRLSGEAIPLTARILCVADVYDALTTTRSYRAAMTSAVALQIMAEDAGRIFDPGLFALFRELVERASPTLDNRFPVFGGSAAA